MKRVLTILTFALFCSNFTLSQDISREDKIHIYAFLHQISLDEKESIAEQMVYPIEFEYPITFSIRNKKDFIEKYDFLFTPEIKSELSKSDIGTIPLQIEGECISIGGIIRAHKSEDSQYLYEYRYTPKELLESSIKSYALKFHPSIGKNLTDPIGFIQTDKFQILLDYNTKTDSYRYSCWNKKASTTSTPDLIIEGGTGGPYKGGRFPLAEYKFTNKGYNYIIHVSVFDVILEVSKGDENLLFEERTKTEGFTFFRR